MLRSRIGFERLWGTCDNLLLVACCVLLGIWIGQSTIRARKGGETVWKESAQEASALKRQPSAGRVVESTRVSLENRDRMATIARSLSDSASWDRAPACPAMDMHEDGKSFEIVFALPEGVDDSRVRVSAQGSILTLAMVSGDGSVLMERFRIPFGVVRGSPIETAVSNDVLRVRIPPPCDN